MESTFKGYPKTKYPYEFVGLVLYVYSTNKNLKETVSWANSFASVTDIKQKRIPKQTIYSWIKNYGNTFQQCISQKEALNYFNEHKIIKSRTTKEQDAYELKKYEQDLSNYYRELIVKYNDKIMKSHPLKLLYPDFPYNEPNSYPELLKFLTKELGKETVITLTKIDKELLKKILKDRK